MPTTEPLDSAAELRRLAREARSCTPVISAYEADLLARAAAEMEALRAALARAEEFARLHEAWEAELILNSDAWDGGAAEFPTLTEYLWDAAMRLAAIRNGVVRAARDAGRMPAPGENEAEAIVARLAEEYRDPAAS